MFDTPERKSKPSPLMTFLFGQPIEFVSPLPLEECVKRLQAKSERTGNWLFQNKRKLLVKIFDGDSYTSNFKMERDAGRNLNVEVVGELRRHDRNTTLVIGQARISRTFYLVVALVFGMHVLIFGVMDVMRPFLIVSALAVGITWVFAALERNKLERVVYNTLSDQIF
jgi:hypothetical protein